MRCGKFEIAWILNKPKGQIEIIQFESTLKKLMNNNFQLPTPPDTNVPDELVGNEIEYEVFWVQDDDINNHTPTTEPFFFVGDQDLDEWTITNE